MDVLLPIGIEFENLDREPLGVGRFKEYEIPRLASQLSRYLGFFKGSLPSTNLEAMMLRGDIDIFFLVGKPCVPEGLGVISDMTLSCLLSVRGENLADTNRDLLAYVLTDLMRKKLISSDDSRLQLNGNLLSSSNSFSYHASNKESREELLTGSPATALIKRDHKCSFFYPGFGTKEWCTDGGCHATRPIR